MRLFIAALLLALPLLSLPASPQPQFETPLHSSPARPQPLLETPLHSSPASPQPQFETPLHSSSASSQPQFETPLHSSPASPQPLLETPLLSGTSPQCGDTVTLLFTGDILLDRGVRRAIERHGFRSLFADDSLRALFRGPQPMRNSHRHYVVGNLECPATTIRQPAFKRFVFRAEPQWLDSLRAYGFTHLNLANNHSVDQGRDGLRDTRQNILRAGLTPLGADSTMSAAASEKTLPPAPPCRAGSSMSSQLNFPNQESEEILSTPLPLGEGAGERLHLLSSNRLPLESFAYLPDRESVSQEPLDSLLRRIRTLRDRDSAAVIVVMLHWGAEHTLRPLPQQRLEAHAIIDAGADAIIGHHPHTLQTIETYRGKPIYYSLGNFIFDQQRPLNARASIVRLRITNDKVLSDTIPILIDHCAPHLEAGK